MVQAILLADCTGACHASKPWRTSGGRPVGVDRRRHDAVSGRPPHRKGATVTRLPAAPGCRAPVDEGVCGSWQRLEEVPAPQETVADRCKRSAPQQACTCQHDRGL